MGVFKRSDAVKAKKIGAHARYVDEDVQRVDLKIASTDGETATIDLSLDQTRQLVLELTNAYGACRPQTAGSEASRPDHVVLRDA